MTESIIIDVSAAQGVIDWPALAASGRCIGAIVKATEGNGFVDQQFARNWKGAAAVGLLVGAYHFARPDPSLNDASREADYFCDTLGDLSQHPRLLLALDIEEARQIHSGPEFDAWVRAFRRRVTERTQRVCWTYTGGPFWAEHAGRLSDEIEAEHVKSPLWIAAYVENPDRFVAMTPWRKVSWTIHQKSGNTFPGAPAAQHYPGIVGEVDTNRYRGPRAQFYALLEACDLRPGTHDPGGTFDDTHRARLTSDAMDAADGDPPDEVA